MKTFLLTGSARGLGRNIAIAILEAGHQLIATARKPEQLDDLVAQYGTRVVALPLDVTDFEAAKLTVKKGIEKFGRIDVLVNNAGFGNVGSVEDMPIEAISTLMNTNFLGSVHVIKAVLPVMREQRAGRIIQVSSIGARIATPGVAAYYASKWAVSGFLESLALEVTPLGISVTAFEPAGMKTDFAKDSSLTVYPSGPAYAETAGAIGAWLKSPGYGEDYADPDDIAAILMKVSDSPTPPVRLLVSASSFELAKAAVQARIESDERWKELSLQA